VDLHVITDTTAQSHHDEATSIAASPDGILKNYNPIYSPFIFLITVLTLLLIQHKRIKIGFDYKNINPQQSCPHFSPLLRAPPLH
jgi:hypothetical protein